MKQQLFPYHPLNPSTIIVPFIALLYHQYAQNHTFTSFITLLSHLPFIIIIIILQPAHFFFLFQSCTSFLFFVLLIHTFFFFVISSLFSIQSHVHFSSVKRGQTVIYLIRYIYIYIFNRSN